MNIGERILFLRKNKGVTQEQLAKSLGVTNQAVSKWESGQCCPDIQIFPEIAKYFSVSVDELLGVTLTNKEDDILILIKNRIQDSKPGTELNQVMKIVKALHAIVWVIEIKKQSIESIKCDSNMPNVELNEIIDHAICNEWGISSVTLPQIVATMRHGSVFFSDDNNLYMDDESIKKISKMLKNLSDKITLSILFAIYEITSSNEKLVADIEQISDKTDLPTEMVENVLKEKLSPYCLGIDKRAVRIRGEYMNIPPILSILSPVI